MQNNEINPFSEEAMNRIQKMLNVFSEQNSPRFYEVIIDRIKVISRTNNPSEFSGYRKHLDHDSKIMRIVIYGSENFENYDEYVFSLKPQEKVNSANEPGDIDKKIIEKISAAKMQWDFDQLKTDKERLETDLKQANEYIETLEKGIDDFKNKKFQLGEINVGELASVVFEGILKRNAHKIAKIPGAEALAGIFADAPQANQISHSENESEVKVEKEMEPSEEDKLFLAAAHWLRANFSNEEIEEVNILLQLLAKNKKDIKTLIGLIVEKSQAK